MAQQNRIGTHATSVSTYNGLTFVRYHNTNVVRFSSDAIILDSGGWLTTTTKLRMNQASNQYGLGIRVYQTKEIWFVDLPNGTVRRFFNGMVINRETGEVS